MGRKQVVRRGCHQGGTKTLEGLGEGVGCERGEFGGGSGLTDAGTVEAQDHDHTEAVAGVDGGERQGEAIDGGFDEAGGRVFLGLDGLIADAGVGCKRAAVGVVQVQGIAMEGGCGGAAGASRLNGRGEEQGDGFEGDHGIGGIVSRVRCGLLDCRSQAGIRTFSVARMKRKARAKADSQGE